MTAPGDLVVMDPDAVNDPIGFDWTLRLAEISPTELLIDSTWTATGPDAAMTFAHDSIVTGQLKTQTKRTGGTLGRTYRVTNHITTTSGVQEDRSIIVLIQNR